MKGYTIKSFERERVAINPVRTVQMHHREVVVHSEDTGVDVATFRLFNNAYLKFEISEGSFTVEFNKLT